MITPEDVRIQRDSGHGEKVGKYLGPVQLKAIEGWDDRKRRQRHTHIQHTITDMHRDGVEPHVSERLRLKPSMQLDAMQGLRKSL